MKNIILVTGPIAVGKTRLIQAIQKEFSARGISYEPEVISDGPYLLEAIKEDHKTGGLRHIDRRHERPHRHSHPPGKELDFNFISTSYDNQVYMFTKHFHDLSIERNDGRFYFADLTVGEGTHWPWHPAWKNDYSNARIVREIKTGRYEDGWINYLAAVIHPDAPFGKRCEWNSDRRLHVPNTKEALKGFVSWPVPDVAMRNTGKDDFEHLERFLIVEGVSPSRIVTIKNTGGPEFFENAMKALERQGIGLPEGQSVRKEMA